LLWCESGFCGLLQERARDSGRMEGHLGFLGINVHADDMAAGGAQELHCNLTQKPQSDDEDGFAQGDLGHADSLQRDAAQRHESG